MELGAGVGREGSGRKLLRKPSPRNYIGRQSGGKSGRTGPYTGRSGGPFRRARRTGILNASSAGSPKRSGELPSSPAPGLVFARQAAETLFGTRSFEI
jgi:hypothetical protein